ncbi:MAG: MFS transporter [Propionibacteriaceae bacterium]|jgi:MFS family permease|nr:MFS transporter [Propionibacteriaceae bacterium]
MPDHSLKSPRAVAAVILLFAYNGLVMGVYASSIAIFRRRLGVDNTELTILLALTGLAAVSSMQLVGRAVDRFGARRACLMMIVPLIIAATGYALAPSYPLLLATGVFLGIGNGGIDVAMNALAVQVENHRLAAGRRPLFSFFHGTWSIGMFAGSLAISLVGNVLKVPANTTLTICGLAAAGIGVFAVAVAWRVTPETELLPHTDDHGQKRRIPATAWLLGLMALAFGLGEGTATDWSTSQVSAVAAVDDEAAAWAVTAMTACMVIIRLTADWLVARFGRVAMVRLGGAVAAVGYLLTAFSSAFPLLILGWALVGLGIGVVAPQVYAAAGNLAGGRGLAMVVTFGYSVFLLGPVVIGALVSWLGIHHAMAVPGALLVGLVAVAGVAMGGDKASSSADYA